MLKPCNGEMEKGQTSGCARGPACNGPKGSSVMGQAHKVGEDSPEPKRRPSPRTHKVVHGSLTKLSLKLNDQAMSENPFVSDEGKGGQSQGEGCGVAHNGERPIDAGPLILPNPNKPPDPQAIAEPRYGIDKPSAELSRRETTKNEGTSVPATDLNLNLRVKMNLQSDDDD